MLAYFWDYLRHMFGLLLVFFIWMGRKKLVYTHDFPYHVMARSNNKEWFYLPQELVWKVFVHEINQTVRKYNLHVYAFVLMNNHYHMLVSTHQNFNLGAVMCYLQTSVSRHINRISGRINHVFGGNYKASLVTTPDYYYNVYKYVYCNPIEAEIVDSVRKYPYSSLLRPNDIYLCSPHGEIASQIPRTRVFDWLDEGLSAEDTLSIQKGLKKTRFVPVMQRRY